MTVLPVTAPAPRTAPGPRGHWLWGIAPAVRRDALGSLLSTARTYGPVAGYRFGPKRGLLVSEPDGARHVLQDHVRNYTKDHPSYGMIGWIAGDGLLTSRGETWLRQRRLAQPAFHRERIAGMTTGMVAEAEAVAARWGTLAAEGREVDVLAEMATLTMAVVGRALLGADVGAETRRVAEAFDVLSTQLVARFRSLRMWRPVLPFGDDRAWRAARRTLDDVVYRLIAARRAAGGEREDLMSLLMGAVDEDGSRMDDRQLHDEVVTMVLAGHETTATTLTWIWALLDGHPGAESRLHAELDAVLRGRRPTLDDLSRLPWTRALVDEALRLYPPVYILSRRAVREDVIAGFRIPAGAWVDVSPYVTHRLASVWPDPDAFRPERFLEDGTSRPRFAYFPFSGGPRQCIGNTFALVEAQLALATLAAQFRVRRTSSEPLVGEPLITLRPRGGLPARIEGRPAS